MVTGEDAGDEDVVVVKEVDGGLFLCPVACGGSKISRVGGERKGKNILCREGELWRRAFLDHKIYFCLST